MACPLITVALCKQCVYICVIDTLSFSSFSNCESHRETSFPTMAASDGFSDYVSSHTSTATSKIIQCYPYCPSVKHCQGKWVPFSNLFLAKTKTPGDRHFLLNTMPAPEYLNFLFIFRSKIFFCTKEGSR